VTLRTKIVVALALLAAAATVTIGVFSYAATANQLRSEIDRSLDNSARTLVGAYQRGQVVRPGRFERPDVGLVAIQYLAPDGARRISGSVPLPVGEDEVRVASSALPLRVARRDVTVDGERFRVATVSLGDDEGAVQVARSLAEYDNVLRTLRNRVLVAGVLVAAAAGAAGWFIARQLTRRLSTLTATAEHVAHTGRLDVAVPVEGVDEAGRLAVAFNEMFAALSRSKEDQQRLVQDAGHELRTPLTSLRTNMSVLRRHELGDDARARVLDDLDSEARELTDLVNELVELATDRMRDEPEEQVDLGALARDVATRAQRRHGRPVTVTADVGVVLGRPHALERAITNLVDNAVKFDDDGTAPVEVVVHDGRVTVLDRGPGVDAADVPHLFDRFYRSAAARSRPGSGLGLAIVREVAERHGGTVFAGPREGGGAAIGFTVPVADGRGA
jgi:two-component system sensor histidine kinase MprB